MLLLKDFYQPRKLVYDCHWVLGDFIMKTTEPSKQEANFKAESTVSWPKVLDPLAVARNPVFWAFKEAECLPPGFWAQVEAPQDVSADLLVSIAPGSSLIIEIITA